MDLLLAREAELLRDWVTRDGQPSVTPETPRFGAPIVGLILLHNCSGGLRGAMCLYRTLVRH